MISNAILKEEPYVYKGAKNITTHKAFVDICKLPQKYLKKALNNILGYYYENVINEDGFIYAKGTDPVLLTAHMDTVHEERVKDFYELREQGKTIISSSQGIGGDDRCGIYMICHILENTDYRPSILFCEDEEIGGVGSKKFCKTAYIEDLKELKFFIELDRANANDAVYYDCGNRDFKDFVREITGYKEAYGSFSDISNLSPATDVASVNLSCGYYNAHTLKEEVVYEEMMDTVEVTEKLIKASRECEAFDYQEELPWRFNGTSWYTKANYDENFMGLSIEYFVINPENNKEVRDYDYIEGSTYEECLGIFMMSHPYTCYDDIMDIEEIYADDYFY